MPNVLFDKSPDDMFIAYKRSRENGNHKKAIKYLHTLLSEFPCDIYFLEEIIEFSLYLEDLEAGKKWLKKITTIRSCWTDYLFLGKVETDLGNIGGAKKYFDKAKTLQAVQPLIKTNAKPKELLRGLEDFIRHKELVLHHTAEKKKEKISEPLKIREQKALDRIEIKNTIQNTAIAQEPQIPEYTLPVKSRHKIPYVTFSGGMSSKDKDNSVARFKNEAPVLVSTEVGGEGRNLQFCNTLVNFDLPWNPMRIEQRIGRLHRIGQTRDVFIFNLCLKDTIEDYIIDILDNKINMFEMIIGEIEPILGSLNEETDFEDIIMDIWLKASSEENLKNSFAQFGEEIVRAKEKYLESKKFDNEIFGEDYEI